MILRSLSNRVFEIPGRVAHKSKSYLNIGLSGMFLAHNCVSQWGFIGDRENRKWKTVVKSASSLAAFHVLIGSTLTSAILPVS